MKELVNNSSKIRLLFVTVAFGIGVDVKNIRHIIHIGVPLTMEEYFQEAGRCGRDGQPSKALVYYNSYDISEGKKNLSETMRKFVQMQSCKRQFILKYFGYNLPASNLPEHMCCDNHQCACDECLLSDIAMLFDTLEDSNDVALAFPISKDTGQVSRSLTEQEEAMIRKQLEEYRSTLHGSGRTCVDSIALATGFSLELIDQVVEQAISMKSPEDVLSSLPVFSSEHARKIFEIVSQVLS